MQSNSQEKFVTNFQKSILLIIVAVAFSGILIFKNILFENTYLIKNLGKESMSPEIAFINEKPTFLEFYAEWCEVCKKMAPNINQIKNDFQNEFNFVFLNVDNQKWGKYIDKFNVNGIPQINLLDDGGNLQATFIGRQEEKTIKEALQNLIFDLPIASNNINYEISQIKENKKFLASPRSHG